MIVYRKGGALRLLRHTAPDPPFWAAGTVLPYSGCHTSRIVIDWINLVASGSDYEEVEIADGAGETIAASNYLHPPLLIDATGSGEIVYRKGDEIAAAALRSGLSVLELITTDGALPSASGERLTVGIAAWPPDPELLAPLARDARERGLRYGVVVPVIPPVTTDLELLERIAEIAVSEKANFLVAVPIDVEPTARRVLAEQQDLDEEGFVSLFETDLELLTVATERHIAALAAERGLADSVVLDLPPGQCNWVAASALASVANRMIRMNRDVEMAWGILRASRTIAALGKPIARIADAASLAIIDPLDPIIASALEEWLERGSSSLMEEVDRDWRLRRDYGV